MNTHTAATAALTLTSLLVLAGCSGGTTSGGSMPGMDHGGGSSSSAAPAQSANANQADVMFASMMIPHHEQAVEMSDTLLSKDGIDERVTALAQQIKAAQGPEITTMKGWLEDWGAGSTDMGGMDHGGGMMSEGDMQALERATGTDAARLFLQQMIEHHRGAINMAEQEVSDGQNTAAVDLANSIVKTQTSEISTMEELLATL
ncbi:DUF305 domain-containing protein [uncultured Microbacterium sp.]|uniref:DUF305 domain-containing protein n=1 Tax=uncultured Microbacterium sp. TaxID=191216 RepID=UPI00374924B8